MPWTDLVEHEEVVASFRRAVARGRLASTFLFVGPAGIGKRKFANLLAQALLCDSKDDEPLAMCDTCASCVQVRAGTHPDVEFVSKPADKSTIPLESFIGDKEHRNREGLCHRIAMKPMQGGRKIAIIDDADYLNVEGANCLLKTLEEPPPRSVIILIGTSLQRQLPTIRSRSQIVRFQPLSDASVERLLLEKQLVESPAEARELAQLSGGSLQQALQLQDPDVRSFREQFLTVLPELNADSIAAAKQVTQFVNAAGKEAPPRRARLKQVANWGMEYYRGRIRDTATGSNDLHHLDREAHRAERCLSVMHQVDANANLTSVIEAWIDEIAR